MFLLLVWLGGELAWDDYRFEETSPAHRLAAVDLQYLAAASWRPLIAARAAFMIVGSLRS